MDIKKIDQVYLQVRRIEGWLPPHACRLFAILDECQKRRGITGNLFEIGVWHGKSAIPLASMLGPSESLGVCDIFDDQDARGDSAKLRRFRLNLQRNLADASRIVIHSKSSRDLSTADVTSNCRLIHIDGAHDSRNVHEDLKLADACLHSEGVIVLDDAYEMRWAGVSDGIYRFHYSHPNRLVPLVGGFQKLALVRPGAVAHYNQDLTDVEVLKHRFAGNGPYCYKTEELMGHPTHIYFERPPVRAAFCPGLATGAVARLPWLRNPATRWLNQKLRALRVR